MKRARLFGLAMVCTAVFALPGLAAQAPTAGKPASPPAVTPAAQKAAPTSQRTLEGKPYALASKRAPEKQKAKRLDLNSATREQLLTLPGLTEKSVEQIVAMRPYKNASQLVTRKIVTRDELAKIQGQVVVLKHSPAKATKPVAAASSGEHKQMTKPAAASSGGHK